MFSNPDKASKIKGFTVEHLNEHLGVRWKNRGIRCSEKERVVRMDNESNPNDEEKLKSLLETLRKMMKKCQRTPSDKVQKAVPGTEGKHQGSGRPDAERQNPRGNRHKDG